MPDLDIARGLAAAGIPVFVAKPATDDSGKWNPAGGTGGTGYRIPTRWQHTNPDPAVLDQYQRGDAVCMVAGHGLDVLDCDPRSGGDDSRDGLRAGNIWPTVIATAATPSGGTHELVNSLGVGSRDGLRPGLDVKAGHGGHGHGFAFIAPTVKMSKTTGELTAYRWVDAPNLDELDPADDTGQALAEMVAQARQNRPTDAADAGPGPEHADLDSGAQTRAQAFLDRTLQRHSERFQQAAGWSESVTDEHGRGWQKLTADCAYWFGRLARSGWSPWTLQDGQQAFTAAVAPVAQSSQRGRLDVGHEWRQQCERGPAVPIPDQVATDGDRADHADPGDPIPLDDARLAQWLTDGYLTGRYLWASGLGWMRWDGRRWSECTDKRVYEVARQALIQRMNREASHGADPDRIKRLAACLAANRIRAIAGLAAGIVEADGAQFDQRADLLNVGNGTIDLITGDLQPHDPNDRLTRITPVDYRPDARHGDWSKALQALPADVADWLQVRVGQAATGHMTPDDVMPVLQGSGANGKSTLLAGIKTALGDHAVTVPHKVLMSNPQDHTTELTTLKGARLALIEETPEAGYLSVKRLKDVLGTPTMNARKIRQDSMEWKCTHSLLLTSNYRPRVDESDHGTWRRLALVRFPWKFDNTGHARDSGLRARLQAGDDGRADAVLTWIVAGARRWYDNDRVIPDPPQQVTDDTADWRAEADLVFAFVTDHLVFDPQACITTTELFAQFNEFLVGRGAKSWSDQTFTTRFGGHAEIEVHGVYKDRTRDTTSVSIRSQFAAPAAGQFRAWLGVRWRHDRDQNAADHENGLNGETPSQTGLSQGVTGSTNIPREKTSFGFTDDPCHTPSQQGSTGPDSGPLQRLFDGDHPSRSAPEPEPLAPCPSGTDCGNVTPGGRWCDDCITQARTYTATLDAQADTPDTAA
jgi:P4 family phage/plasmid primase-like protien